MTGERRLRVGIVGLGWAGRQHLDAWSVRDDAELVGLAGQETELLAELAEQYGIPGAGRFGDWRALIAAGGIDALSIATPTALHAPIAGAALDAGIHVLCEKPMAENAAAAASMVAAAERNDRVLDISFNHRRRADVQALRGVVEKGLLGRVYYAKTGWLRRDGIPGLGSWFTRRELAGGGPLMDLGVHMLDLTLFLLGEPAVRTANAAAYAEFGPLGRGSGSHPVSTARDGGFDVEDLATAFLRLDDGATLTLEASWAQWIPHDQVYVELYGTDGGARIAWGGPPGDRINDFGVITSHTAGRPETAAHDGGHAQCVADFVAAIEAGDHDPARLALTRAVAIDACYESARLGSEVNVSRTGVPTI